MVVFNFLLLLVTLLSNASSTSDSCSSFPSTLPSLASAKFRSLPAAINRRLHTVSSLTDAGRTVFLLYGGINVASRRQVSDDPNVYLYSLDQNSFADSTLAAPSSANAPDPRFGHSSVTWQNSVYVLNGFTTDYTNEVWRVDVPLLSPLATDAVNVTWTSLNYVGESTPEGTYGSATSVLHSSDDFVVVVNFGGVTTGGASINTLTLLKISPTEVDHYEVAPTAETPSERSDAASALLENGCVYIYGGIDVLAGNIHDDLFSLCPSSANLDWTSSLSNVAESLVWTLLTPVLEAFQPPASYGSIMSNIGATGLLLHGGSGSWPNLFVPTVSSYDTALNVWSDITDAIGPSNYVRYHSAASVNGTAVVYFGGETDEGNTDSAFFSNFTAKSCGFGYATAYCTETASVVCLPCEAGKYAEQGDYECTSCPQGKYSLLETSGECTACGKGEYGADGPGASETSHCVKCPAGTSSDALAASGVAACTLCLGGSAASLGSWNCTACDAGFFATSNSESCSSCSAGSYSLASASSCVPCVAGRYQPDPGSSACEPCVAGTTSGSSASNCVDCLAGSFSSSSSSPTCTSCPGGKYQTESGQTDCNSCDLGKYSALLAADDESTCSPCEEGKYAPSTPISACTSCQAGKYQENTGKVLCDDCAFGKYSVAIMAVSVDTCTNCPVGRFTLGEGSPAFESCKSCEAGSYSLPGEGAGCQPCPRGRFSSSIAQASEFECQRCERNSYSTLGQTSCQACPADSFSHLGYSLCIPCSLTSPASAAAAVPGISYSGSLQHFYVADELAQDTWLDISPSSYFSTTTIESTTDVGILTVPFGQTTPYTSVPLEFAVAAPLVLRGFARASPSFVLPDGGKFSIELEISTQSEPNTFMNVLSITFSESAPDSWQFLEATFYPFPHQIANKARVFLYNEGTAGAVEWAGIGLFNSVTGSCSCEPGFYLNFDTPNCRTCEDQPLCRSEFAECYRCPIGHFCAAGIMMECPDGEHSWGGSVACEACPDGWICNNGIALPCASDGSIVSETGTCDVCPPGFNCRNGVNYECTPGTYSPGGNGDGGKQCIPCAPGTFSSSAGATSCKLCAPGTTSNHGSSSCTYCNTDEFTTAFGAFPCLSCAMNTTTPPPSATYLVSSFAALVESFDTGDFEGAASSSYIEVETFSAMASADFSRASAWFVAPSTGDFTFFASGDTSTSSTVVRVDGEIATDVAVNMLEGQWYFVSMEVSGRKTPSHEWDFRNCDLVTTSATTFVIDSVGGDVKASLRGTATCGLGGIMLDGESGYLELDNWSWGGDVAFEVYVYHDAFRYHSRVFDFNDGLDGENVMLYNNHGSSKMRFGVHEGGDSELFEVDASFNSAAWTHVVITVVGGVYNVWKDGVLVGVKSDGLVPDVLERSSHLIGATAWGGSGPTNFLEGIVGYFRMWEGTENSTFEQHDVDAMYASASGGLGERGDVELGMIDSDGVEWNSLDVNGLFTMTLPSGCPFKDVESVVFAGSSCSWGEVGSAEIAATESDVACDGSSVRCLDGTMVDGEADCYGIPFYENACAKNSDSWFQKGRSVEERGCSWVAEKPRSRCTVTNDDNVAAWKGCREACYCCDNLNPCASATVP